MSQLLTTVLVLCPADIVAGFIASVCQSVI